MSQSRGPEEARDSNGTDESIFLPDGQAAELIGLVSPRKPALDALQKAGSLVKVDVSGVAESGSGLHLSPDVLAGLAELGVPLTFTTVRASGEDEEDPLAWLG